MKIQYRRHHGSVLVVLLVLTVVMGFTLGSYLQMVSNQNLSVMRSMAWNNAIAVAEAGIEEAMAHLNANTTNRVLDAWVHSGTNVIKEKTFNGSKYKVYVNKDVDPPQIISEGYVVNPVTGKFLDTPRIVRVGTTNDARFAKGLVAKGQIDLSGNNIKTDSFDSTDPAYSTNGRYDAAKNKDGGDIATNSSVVDSLNVWNAEIYGKASTGPGGNIKIGVNGAVGGKAWHAAGNTGIQPGWSTDDMNVYFPDAKAPFSGGALTPLAETISGSNYEHVLYTGNYQLPSINYSGGNKMLVRGDATLLVTGDISMTGLSQIIIATNASLRLYVSGAVARIGGNGILNNSGKALNFSYVGLNSNKQVNMEGNAAFVGTIYAPQAALSLGGGGSTTYDFVGASVSNSVKMNGHYNFHYDESLKIWGPRRGYTIISWSENTFEEL
jgi:hypothetical protein